MNIYKEFYEKNETFWKTVRNTEDPGEAANYIRLHYIRHSPLFFGATGEDIGFWCTKFAQFAEEISKAKQPSQRFDVVFRFKMRAESARFKARDPEDQKKIFTGPSWIGSYVRSTQRRMNDGR